MGEFRMPSLGADMEVGTVVEWRIKPGDNVHRGDVVAVVDTEKADIEVEVFEDGVVEELLIETGVAVPVGTALARLVPIASATRSTKAAAPRPIAEPVQAPVPKLASRAPKKRAPKPKARPTDIAAARGTGSSHVRSSPYARRQAAAGGIDVATVTGSGPDGAVIAADLASTAHDTTSAETPTQAVPKRDRQASRRHAIGALMARSKREIPHYYLGTTIDMSSALAWLAETNANLPASERLLPAALILKATARAAAEAPAMNGFFDTEFRPSSDVHLGVAVSLRGGGLVAPAIHSTDQLSLPDLMNALRDLVSRARAGALRSSEMADPTLTVTNLGDQGVEEVFGVIYPPQVALVGFGKIVERPWASGAMVGSRPTVRATLAADHRASDGHTGALFLSAIDRYLQSPEAL
jgi:pyruvate dehydrogenase E2 component (dihydrolipoamide acetyltransferase)